MTARPVFLKFSLAVFVVLLPFLAYSVWDVVEATRLRSRIDAIPPPAAAQPVSRDAAQAARYYLAAAALYSNDETAGSTIEESNGTLKALRSGSGWTPAFIAHARRRVEQNRDALGYLDRASDLPFVEFAPGTDYNNRWSVLMQLAQLAELRSVVLAGDGDGDGAVKALYSEARLSRAFRLGLGGMLFPPFRNLPLVLQQTRPAASAVEKLAASLAELDRDDLMSEIFIRFRVRMLNEVSRSRPPSRQPGAFTTHLSVRALDAFTDLIAASRQPWTTRVPAMIAVDRWPQPDTFALGSNGSRMLTAYVRSIAEEVKRIRCARLTIDGTLNVIDPFSGRRLEMLNCRL